MVDTETKLVVLAGSLRDSSTHRAVARSLQGLSPSNVHVSMLGSVGEIPHYDADTQADGFPASVLEMGEAIAKADGVVIVTPEYNYSVPGSLKNALDWLSRLTTTPFAGKPVSMMTGSPGAIGGARAYHGATPCGDRIADCLSAILRIGGASGVPSRANQQQAEPSLDGVQAPAHSAQSSVPKRSLVTRR